MNTPWIIVVLIILSSWGRIYSQTITSTAAGGNWNSGSTWVGGIVPGPSNSVIIAGGGGTVTLNVNATIINLTIDNGGLTRSRLAHNSGMSLTVTGTVTMVQSSVANVNNGWRIDAGSATVTGLISFTGTSTDATRISTIRISSGTLNANGGISFTTSVAAGKVIDMSQTPGTGTLNLRGTLTAPSASSTLTPGTAGSTFNYADVNPQTISFFSSGSYFNLNINNTSSGGATLGAAITSTNVTGNITVGNVNAGSLFSTGNFNIGLANSRNLTISAGSTISVGTSVVTFPATPGSAVVNGIFKTANTNGFSGSTTTAINSANNPTINLGTGSTVEYNATGTQTVTSRVYGGNLTLTGGSKTIGTAAGQTVTVASGFTVNSGATWLGSTNNPAFNVGGVFSNSGTFTQGTGLVTFNGTSAQTIQGSSPTTFSGSMTLNNAAGLTISTSPTVLGTLTLSNGKITTGAGRLILGSAATIAGAGAGKYVYGNLEIFVPNTSSPAVNFPIGDASNYTPVLIAFSGTTNGSGSLVVHTDAGDHPDIANSGIDPNLSVNRYWTITQGTVPVAGFTSYSGTFTFNNGTPVDLDAGANTANFIINKLTGGAWGITATGTRTTTSTQATGMTTFGEYQIGEQLGVVISTQPSNTSVCDGAPASFTSTSNSVPIPTVQWQRDPNTGTFTDINSSMDGGVYANFTTTTLNISSSTGLNNFKYRAVFTNVNGTATSNAATLTIITPPSQGGTISGSSSVCQGQSGVLYSIAIIPGATSYNWSFTGTGFTPSGSTASITAVFSSGATSGTLSVYCSNSCGNGPVSNPLPIVVNPLPSAAGPISGTNPVCQGQSGYSYSVSPVSGATSYSWSYSGTGFSPSGTTSSITGSFTSSATSGNLTVSGVNGCGNGTASTGFAVTVNSIPSAAGTITGSSSVCQGQNSVAYSITPVAGATGYSWSYSGTGFTPSGNTSSITANFSAGATSGNLTVTGVNACGNGGVSQSFAITLLSSPPGPGGSISGSSTVCQGQTGVAYSIPAIAGATSYTWTYSGTGFTPSGNTALITASFSAGATAGTLTVKGVNACGSGATSSAFPISMTTGVGPAGSISGASAVCQSGAAVYSVSIIPGATSYTWNYTGTGFTSSGATAAITGTFSATATSGNLTVTGNNACGTGATSPNFPVTVGTCPPHNSCNGCHINHTTPGVQLTLVGGNANLCMSCHNPSGVASSSPFMDIMKAVPGVSGTSHSWNANAVSAWYQTTLPTDPEMQTRIYSNQIVCSTCHNQHSNTISPFLRTSNVEDALCLKCHAARDIKRYSDNPANKGSHPVGIAYTPGTDPRFQATTFPLSASGNIVCSTCHSTHYSTSADGNILRSATINAGCTNCHIEVQTRKTVNHEGLTCTTCHYAHQTGSNNILLIRDTIITPTLGSKTVLFTSNSNQSNYGDGIAPFNGICEVCHTTAVDHYQSASGGTSDARHLPAPQNCTGCHPHNQGFAPQTDCFACHNAITDKPGVGPAGGRRQIVDNLGNGTGTGGDFKRTSHHFLGSIPTVDDCLLCHYMGDHKKGVVKLFDPDQGYLSVITYDPVNKSSIENFCLNCHDANGSAGDLTPFSDNTAVPAIDKTAWLASSHKGKPYTCLDCHDNGHGSNKSNLLSPWNYAGTGTGTDLMNEEEGFCLTSCHGSGGVATAKVHLAFSSYTNTATRFFKHDPNATYRKHINGETGGAAFAGTNRHVECVDCHNPHAAKAGTATAPALYPTMTGVTGVEPIYSGAGAPTGFTWTNSITQEYQACYKCHSSYTTLQTYLPDGVSNATTPTYVTDGLRKLTSGGTNLQIADSRDMAREFNPNAVSYHPVMAVGKNTGILASTFQSGYSATSRIYCSSCHGNPNSTISGQGRGPHGSSNLHILDKGINATIVNLVTSHGSVSNVNELCSKCHTATAYYTGSTGSRFTYHSYHSTKGECYVCHDNHGSEQFHMINFNRNSGGGNSCISSVTTNTQAAFVHANGTTPQYCLMTCHGVQHLSDKLYTPSYP